MSRQAPSKRPVDQPPQSAIPVLPPPQFNTVQWSNSHPPPVGLSISPREILQPHPSRLLRRDSISPYTTRSSARTTNQLFLPVSAPQPQPQPQPLTLEQTRYAIPPPPRPNTPEPESQPDLKPARITRPPNAFILFRSDFLKRKVIPKNVECRQQHLSRVVGEIWRMLSEEEKAVWRDKALEASEAHRVRNPNYKPTSASRKGKKKQENLQGDELKTKITEIRETFTSYKGPAPAPSRSRSTKKSTRRTRGHCVSDAPEMHQPTALVPAPSMQHTAQAGPSRGAAVVVAPMGRYTEPLTFQHEPACHLVPPRRPSTSLGLPFTYEIGQQLGHLRSKGEVLPLPTRPSSATPDHSITTFPRWFDSAPHGPLSMPFGTHPLSGLAATDYPRRYPLGGDPHVPILLPSSISAPAALNMPLSTIPEAEDEPYLSQLYPGLTPSDTIAHDYSHDPLQTSQLSVADPSWHTYLNFAYN
ncbi:hypothetical protein BDN72DRAFT_359116 [Pluteus cervinus]|uniref:Uncharacterized protein n=1 Tax=Pluteus cervinus TaxID=181527 RepID=A0ACD3BD80_9AGAR|nr:hypothetical protein BDN72DRAFT_359116 [Pluteus cervinus]